MSTVSVTHFFSITTQDSGIPRDPSQIGTFIREQFRAAGRVSAADALEQRVARIRGLVFGEKDARK